MSKAVWTHAHSAEKDPMPVRGTQRQGPGVQRSLFCLMMASTIAKLLTTVRLRESRFLQALPIAPCRAPRNVCAIPCGEGGKCCILLRLQRSCQVGAG